jgi:ribonuclease P protein component
MLSQDFRFHGHGSLRYLHRNGQTVRDRALLLKYTENNHRDHSRVAVVVGKKIAKSSAKRNRIRRRVFEVVRLHWGNIKPHHDLMFTVFTAEFLTMPYSEVEQHVIALLTSAHLYSSSGTESAKIESNL